MRADLGADELLAVGAGAERGAGVHRGGRLLAHQRLGSLDQVDDRSALASVRQTLAEEGLRHLTLHIVDHHGRVILRPMPPPPDPPALGWLYALHRQTLSAPDGRRATWAVQDITDYAARVFGMRDIGNFRVNIFRQRGSTSIVIRFFQKDQWAIDARLSSLSLLNPGKILSNGNYYDTQGRRLVIQVVPP